ncbi:ATP-dependent transcriptional regulator [Fuerstiella marisgermanici]|uniref:ATP-dependent transcriptional regulator n=2 Tax=Fuerstiella marisgermanici TaxID=1891926 RepID=A0A1P8WAB5_9PLAN|nr:ATP-dependent transcriptional regulator [Fuerstiella marisgermanici]
MIDKLLSTLSLTDRGILLLVMLSIRALRYGSLKTGSLVYTFDYLFFIRPCTAPRGDWKLIRKQPYQLLPIEVPFDLCGNRLQPAAELFAEGEIDAALKFVRMVAVAEATQPCQLWPLHLVAVMLLLECGRSDDAWNQLQQALAVRNETESPVGRSDAQQSIAPREWLVMATAALAVNDFEGAERYASECVAIFDQRPSVAGCELLSDCRADAMTVFAAIRLSQHKIREAEMLLQLAHDAYTQVGDMQQLAVTLVLLADVEQLSGSPVSASYLLSEADQLLAEECDTSRHFRIHVIREAIASRRLRRGSSLARHNSLCLN